jgi:phospholipase C
LYSERRRLSVLAWRRQACCLPAVLPRSARPPRTVRPRHDDADQHLVVIYQENISFDHYFGTYPNATNPPGEPMFTAKPNTPSVNGLSRALLTNNPNLANPQRLDPSVPADVVTCDQDHGYRDEQKAFDNGLMEVRLLWMRHSSAVHRCNEDGPLSL